MKRTISLILSVILMVATLHLPIKAKGADFHSKAGAVTTDGASLNVRASASTSAGIVASLRKGSYITLLSKSGAWWRVEYGKNQYGYCHGDYITVVQGSPAAVSTQTGSLNVRSGPGTAYGKVASLQKGEAVLRLSVSNGWSRVLYHGTKTGYVSDQYLSGGTSGYAPVSLYVPSFKQTDGRWANVLIGNSGKTIASIGCATTAIAMMESYRTGTTIYPDAMSKKLSYTSSGSVYWPSHYVTVTNSTGYLSDVYRQLEQGRPVLFGAKNTHGGQHWVVITGFVGGSLTPAGFAIHDPGSKARVNLQQFLNAYPSFYKYFYYK